MWVSKSKKTSVSKKYYIWNSSKNTCKNSKYLENITDNSVFTCNEIIDAVRWESTKLMSINFNDKRLIYEMGNFYVLFALLLIPIFLWYLLLILLYKTSIKRKRDITIPP